MTATTKEQHLAAIEAVTGEEVRNMAGQCRLQAREGTLDPDYERFMLSVSDALLSLSAKVAEQAEEIERLRKDSADMAGCMIADHDELEMLRGRVSELTASGYRLSGLAFEAKRQRDDVSAERDTLRRLLTETAVPALSMMAQVHNRHAQAYLERTGSYARFDAPDMARRGQSALSTIRAQME